LKGDTATIRSRDYQRQRRRATFMNKRCSLRHVTDFEYDTIFVCPMQFMALDRYKIT